MRNRGASGGVFDVRLVQDKGLQYVQAFEGVEVSPRKATKEKICDPTPGSSIRTTGVCGQVTTPLESMKKESWTRRFSAWVRSA